MAGELKKISVVLLAPRYSAQKATYRAEWKQKQSSDVRALALAKT